MIKNIFSILNYKKTNFIGGDLEIHHKRFDKSKIFKSRNFRAPKKLDFRDMCVETSDQSTTPHCAGYSMAGMLEVDFWRKNHYPKQFDGRRIYIEAKKIDRNKSPGTSLESASQAVLNLGLKEGKSKFISNSIQDIKFGVHANLSFVAGFQITNEWNRVNKKTGEISNFGERAKPLGGHAVLICGYDDNGVYIQNSWGDSWGIWGFGLIPWNQVLNQFIYGVVIV